MIAAYPELKYQRIVGRLDQNRLLKHICFWKFQPQICILDIDVQGVRNVKKSSLDPRYVFIAPPSMDILESRLRSRGTEKEEDIVKRLGNAAAELEYGNTEGNMDKVFVNDDLDTTFAAAVASFKEWYPQLVEG